MDRDMPLAPAGRETWDSEPEALGSGGSLLDRSLVLPVATGRWLTALATIVAAVLLRFIGLDRFPLSAAGAEVALAARDLVRGERVPSNLYGAPFAVEWTGLFMFVGGASDAVARLALAVAGVLAVIGVLRLGRWLGPLPALAGALLVATSPTLVASARRVDGGALYVALTVAIVGAALLAWERGGLAWPALAGAGTALCVLAGPLGLPAALLAWFGAYRLLRTRRLPGRDALLAGAAAGLGALVLFSTALLTRPGSFSASLGESLILLWNDHLTEAGTRWWMPAFDLILNEPLLIALAIVALVAAPQRALARATGMWFVVAFVGMSLLGDVGVAGYALATLPLALLAGVGAAHLVERLPWGSFRRGPAALYVVTVLLLAAAALSLWGLVADGTGADRADWLLRFVLVIGVGVLPLILALSAFGARVAGHRGVLVLGALLVVLGALTVRSATLAASERPAVAGDPLSAGMTGEDIGVLVGRLGRVSRDLTVNTRDAQDPGGGHGLRIAIDEQVAQPFRWYFRDYPNVTVFDPATQAAPPDAQVVFLAGDRDARASTNGFRGQPYLYERLTPDAYRAPDWGGLLTGVVTPNRWRDFATFMIKRSLQNPAPTAQFQLLAAPDVADRLFPATGPYGLDDRPGAGNGQGQFNRPRGIAVAPDGTTYVVDSRNTRVEVFTPAGDFAYAFGSEGSGNGQLARFTGAGGGGPGGIAIGSDGNLYVADTWNHRIEVFTPDGQVVRTWGVFYDAKDDPTQEAANGGKFYGPRGIAIRDGLVYVTDTGNERVQVFQEDGTFVRVFGTTGSGQGQLLEPVGIAVASDGTVLVADSHNARIARFDANGQPLDPWPVDAWQGLRFFEPYLALAPDGTLYATASQANAITPFSPDGVAQPVLRAPGMKQPYGIAVTPDGGELLVTDGSVSAVLRVDLGGAAGTPVS